MMRTSNPTLRADTFTSVAGTGTEVMTIGGTVNKSAILLLLALFSASWAWRNPGVAVGFIMPAVFGGFICVMVLMFKRTWAPMLAPIYALVEGVILGALSAMFERQYPGLVMQAVALTFGTLFSLLIAYKARLIQATSGFKRGIIAATGGICLLYFTSFILGFFGIHLSFLHEGSLLGIGFSLFVVVIAALNLVLDFDFIEQGANVGAPKYMEWYAAFGLLVTLVWLYLEILRLLAKLQDRR